MLLAFVVGCSPSAVPEGGVAARPAGHTPPTPTMSEAAASPPAAAEPQVPGTPAASASATVPPPAGRPTTEADSDAPDASAPLAVATTGASQTPAPAPCPEPSPRPGFEECHAVELTGEPPCELICRRPRPAAAARCCHDPIEVVARTGKRVILRVAACDFVPPECAHRHGHGNMDSELRILAGSPPDVIVVEGGCEARALMHGYVPAGVAAWTGCQHRRYRWNGSVLALEREPGR